MINEIYMRQYPEKSLLAVMFMKIFCIIDYWCIVSKKLPAPTLFRPPPVNSPTLLLITTPAYSGPKSGRVMCGAVREVPRTV